MTDTRFIRQGEEWKDLRKRVIGGFAPQHLLTLTPAMLEKSQRFFDHLDRYVVSGEDFGLGELATNLAFDVIGEWHRRGPTIPFPVFLFRVLTTCIHRLGIITFDQDLKAQIPGEQSPVLTSYRECQQEFLHRKHSKILPKWWTDRELNARSKRLDRVLKDLIQEEFRQKARGESTSRSAMALSLHDVETLTPQILQQTSDTLRGFLFAGHDTTSILMQWAFYELMRCPRALATLRDELDEVFGSDPHPSAVRERLLTPGGEKLMTRLPCEYLLQVSKYSST